MFYTYFTCFENYIDLQARLVQNEGINTQKGCELKIVIHEPPHLSVSDFLKHLGYGIDSFFTDHEGNYYIHKKTPESLCNVASIVKLEQQGIGFIILFTSYNRMLKAYNAGRPFTLKALPHIHLEVAQKIRELYRQNKNKAKINIC